MTDRRCCRLWKAILAGSRCTCQAGTRLLLRAIALLFAVDVGVAAWVGALVFLPPASASIEGELDRQALLESQTVHEIEIWAGDSIPGIEEADLGGMHPDLAREFAFTVADLARQYRVEVRYLLPRERWEGVTGEAGVASTFFATPDGIAFSPEDWGEEQAATLHLLDHIPFAEPGPQAFRAMVAHEMGHLVTFRASVWSQSLARRPVESYRTTLGPERVISELGAYAWYGDSSRPEDAWKETFAQAFAAHHVAPDKVSPETRGVVQAVLDRLGY
jgi:hypothetical protein